LPQLGNCPDTIKRLYVGGDSLSVEFRREIRTINSMFAMASFKLAALISSVEANKAIGASAFAGKCITCSEGFPVVKT